MTRLSDIRLLDVGGTFIKCGDGRCIPIASGGSREEIAAALQQAVALQSASVPQQGGTGLQRAEMNPAGEGSLQPGPTPLPIIAVAIPGPFDFDRGIFLMRHKFAAVYGESFRTLAALPADIEIYYCHDVVAALEGCLAAGQPGAIGANSAAADKLFAQQMTQDARMDGAPGPQAAPPPQTGNIALVTIGTGLGFAYAEAGAVQVGPTGSPARSIYNLPWGDGILEDVVSARGIRAAYQRLSGRADLSAAQIATLARNNDEAALQVFSDLGAALGEALAPVLEELGVETLLLAGQVSRSLNLFERPLRNALEGIDMRPAPDGAVFAGLERLVRAAHPHLDD